jgi:hypothetical protein
VIVIYHNSYMIPVQASQDERKQRIEALRRDRASGTAADAPSRPVASAWEIRENRPVGPAVAPTEVVISCSMLGFKVANKPTICNLCHLGITSHRSIV